MRRASTLNGVKKQAKHDWILHPDLVVRNPGEKLDPDELDLAEELKGWHGYIEWELYPERKEKIKEWMRKFEFPGVCFLPVLAD